MTGSVSFVPEIIESAKVRGVALSPEDIESINENMGFITTVEDGAIKFTAGPFLDVAEAVEAMSRGYGKLVVKPAQSVQTGGLDIPANATATERAMALNAAIRANRNGAKQAQAETLVATYGSPWVTGNKTHAAYVTNVHPQLAARLRAEAGLR